MNQFSFDLPAYHDTKSIMVISYKKQNGKWNIGTSMVDIVRDTRM